MTSIPVKLILSAFGLAFVMASASPADAAQKKHKKARLTAQVVDSSKYRGTNLFPAGPLYHGREYLGDDPDPNIRFQIWRDLSGRYGGDSN